jgi:hypothetical protein
MENCVGSAYYKELLALFVERLRDMKALRAPATPVSFANAQNAFEVDWAGYLGAAATAGNGAAATAGNGAAATVPAVPQPLTSIVVFHVCAAGRTFTPAPEAVAFADQVIAETQGAPTDPALAALMVDVNVAALAEGFSVFHAVATPQTLAQRLAQLSRQGVVVAIALDPEIRESAGPAINQQIGEIIRADGWTGPVLLPDFGAGSQPVNTLPQEALSPLVALPRSSQDRVDVLRKTLITARGSALRRSTGQHQGAEGMPLLKNSTTESRAQ